MNLKFKISRNISIYVEADFDYLLEWKTIKTLLI